MVINYETLGVSNEEPGKKDVFIKINSVRFKGIDIQKKMMFLRLSYTTNNNTHANTQVHNMVM